MSVKNDDAYLTEIDGKMYTTARAWVVESPEQLPRELASEIPKDKLNPTFLWVAGRYVQGNRANKNGHYWTLEDLQAGESSIRHSPINTLHRWDRPVGTYVQTKIVHRNDRMGASQEPLPEIQALGVIWGANFPEVATMAKAAHQARRLHFSMECVAEQKQCLTCGETFAFTASAAETCEHLASSAAAPRRFINPTFLGGALIYPPEKPAWPDAEITELATEMYAHREREDVAQRWESAMELVMSINS